MDRIDIIMGITLAIVIAVFSGLAFNKVEYNLKVSECIVKNANEMYAVRDYCEAIVEVGNVK